MKEILLKLRDRRTAEIRVMAARELTSLRIVSGALKTAAELCSIRMDEETQQKTECLLAGREEIQGLGYLDALVIVDETRDLRQRALASMKEKLTDLINTKITQAKDAEQQLLTEQKRYELVVSEIERNYEIEVGRARAITSKPVSSLMDDKILNKPLAGCLGCAAIPGALGLLGLLLFSLERLVEGPNRLSDPIPTTGFLMCVPLAICLGWFFDRAKRIREAEKSEAFSSAAEVIRNANARATQSRETAKHDLQSAEARYLPLLASLRAAESQAREALDLVNCAESQTSASSSDVAQDLEPKA